MNEDARAGIVSLFTVQLHTRRGKSSTGGINQSIKFNKQTREM